MQACHAVEAKVYVLLQGGAALVGIPACIGISRFACEEVGKGNPLAERGVTFFATIAKTSALGLGDPTIYKGLPSILIPRVLQEVFPADVGEQHGDIVESFYVVNEVTAAIVPNSVAIEAGCRGTCSP